MIIPTLKSQHGPLVMPTDEDREEVLALYNQANVAGKKVASQKLESERRSLTLLLELTEACIALSRKREVNPETRKKLEKDDWGLYGIVVASSGPGGQSVPGTTVTSGNARGHVVGVEKAAGYNQFTIRWTSCKESKYCLDDVLREGCGVVTPDDAKKKMDLWFAQTLTMVNVQVSKIIDEDILVEFKKYTVPLSTRELSEGYIMDARKWAWEKTSDARGVDVLNDHEVRLLASVEDEGLVGELEKPFSCLEMMGLNHFANLKQTGLVHVPEKFHHKHVPKVTHYIRGAQAAFKLGRLTNLASSCMFVSRVEIPPVPPGSNARDLVGNSLAENQTATFVTSAPSSFSLSVRALLARARVRGGSGDDSSSSCQWLVRYPLYRLLLLSRSDGCTVAPNSENLNVSQTRRHKDSIATVAEMNGDSGYLDSKLFADLDQKYLLTAREKKNAARTREEENRGVGVGAMVMKGKMHLVGSRESIEGVERLVQMCLRNSIEPFMEKLPSREENVDMCMRVLLQHQQKVGVQESEKNEDHLYPEERRGEIDKIVAHMIKEKGVTREEVSLLSRALMVMDDHTAAALREEDIRGQNACDLDVIDLPGVGGGAGTRLVRCQLPPYFKNRKATICRTKIWGIP